MTQSIILSSRRVADLEWALDSLETALARVERRYGPDSREFRLLTCKTIAAYEQWDDAVKTYAASVQASTAA